MSDQYAPAALSASSLLAIQGVAEDVPSAPASIESLPGLVRMVLVDTKLFPGAISEVPLDGNTLVTGTNAAGKTSIIQLLPLFYGVSPSKISKKSQGKDFYKHYLPRSTSYVAFEFRHRDGSPRSVIVHAAQSEDKPMFRFVRSALYEGMFLDDEDQFVTASNLASHLRNRGYQVADRIIETLTDYQAIIQGLPMKASRSKDESFLAQMTAQYSATQLRSPLINMDRVVYSMLKKDVSLQALEEMIAEKILQDDADIQVDDDRQKLENWPTRYRAYQDVMAQETAARLLDRKCVELRGHKADRTAALSELLALHAKLERDVAAENTHETALSRTLKAELEDYLERKEVAHEATGAALRSKNALIDAIHVIEAYEKSRKAIGIDATVELADRKYEIEADQKEVRDRFAALSGAQGELTEKYGKLKVQTRDAVDGELEAVREDARQARQHHAEALFSAKARHADAEASLRQGHVEPIRRAEERVDAANEARGAARQQARTPQVSQEVLDRRDEASRVLAERQQHLNAALRDGQRLQDDVRNTEKSRDAIAADIAGLESSTSELRAEQVRLEASKKPKPGTLLAYLRESREDWGDDIGRVINPALLQREDLAPEETASAGALYGLRLDISSVDPVAEADISGIEATIEEAKAEIAELQDDIAKAGLRRVRADEDCVKARRAMSDHQGQQTLLEQSVTAYQRVLEAREQDIARDRDRMIEIARERLALAEEEVERARAARKLAQTALETALAELGAAHAAEGEALDQGLRQALGCCEQREKDAKFRLKKRHDELDAELAQALARKGIDPRVMADLQERVSACDADLASIRRDDGVVNAWRHFVATERPKLPGLRSGLKAAEIAHASEEAKENRLKADWMLRERSLNIDIEAARSKIAEIARQVHLIEKRLSGTDVSGIPPAAIIVRDFGEIAAFLNEVEARIRMLGREIQEGVARISKVFLDQPGSPAEQHLSGRRANFASTVEGPEWVPVLIEWFDTLHQQHRDNLLGDGRTITNNIKNAYFRLVSLDKQIQVENRALQASLDRNNVINVVQDLNVGITSSIRKLDFMPAMDRLSKLHETWVKSGRMEPPEGFTDAMTSLLTFWRSRERLTANLRDQIRIEGYIVENGNRRDFHARTDLTDISSNGVSYLVLTTILVGFVNMVRGKSPVHVVWALDELGNIDAGNTRRLLDMLRQNNITLVAATPSASASVNSLFDYRVKVIDGPRLADIKGAGRPSRRLLASPWALNAPLPAVSGQAAATNREEI
jgi:DNA repair exonuclease SbcCD ATPase subunit